MVYLRWCDSASFKIILLSQLRCRLWQATYKAAYLPSHQAPVMPMPVQVQWDGPAKLADAGSAVVPFGLLRGSPKFPPRWLEYAWICWIIWQDSLFQRIDSNHDGVISAEEAVAQLHWHRLKRGGHSARLSAPYSSKKGVGLKFYLYYKSNVIIPIYDMYILYIYMYYIRCICIFTKS